MHFGHKFGSRAAAISVPTSGLLGSSAGESTAGSPARPSQEAGNEDSRRSRHRSSPGASAPVTRPRQVAWASQPSFGLPCLPARQRAASVARCRLSSGGPGGTGARCPANGTTAAWARKARAAEERNARNIERICLPGSRLPKT